MESDARPPENLSNKGPMARNWKYWKQNFLLYMKLTGGMNKSEDEKAAWLKNLIGQVGLEALETISFDSPEDKENMTIIIQKLEEVFDPPKSEVEERNKFFSRTKKGTESIDVYIEDLKTISKFCNFGGQTESLVRDAVILDTKDQHLRKILFEEKDLDLEKLKIIYKTYDLNNAKINDVSRDSIPEAAKSVQGRFVQKKPVLEPKNPCWRCGEKHPFGQCRAFRNLCCYCKNYNHFSHRCPVAKLDSNQIASPGTNADPNRGYTNNLNLHQNKDKEKEIPKSASLINNVENVDSGTRGKGQNQFLTLNNLGKVTSKHPLLQTRTGMQPSALPKSLLDLKIEKPTKHLSPGRKEFQTNINKIPDSSKKGPKHETSKSDALVRKVESADLENLKKVQNEFQTCSYLEKVTSQHPLLQTRTGLQPSVPPKPLLDSKIDKPRKDLPPGRKEFLTKMNKILESSEEGRKHETSKSDCLYKNGKIADSENLEKVQNKCSNCSNLGKVTPQHPLLRTKIGLQPSAPPEFLLDSKIQEATTQLSVEKTVFQTNKVKIVEPSEEAQRYFEIPRSQNSQPPRDYAPLYPKLPNSASSVPRYSQDDLQSSSRCACGQYTLPNYISSSANITKETAKPKHKFVADCAIS